MRSPRNVTLSLSGNGQLRGGQTCFPGRFTAILEAILSFVTRCSISLRRKTDGAGHRGIEIERCSSEPLEPHMTRQHLQVKNRRRGNNDVTERSLAALKTFRGPA